MNYEISEELEKRLKEIKQRDSKLADRIKKQLKLFEENPQHPSLRLHKLSGNLKNIWSISIGKNIRMVYFLEEGSAYFFGIGTHDQVYKR